MDLSNDRSVKQSFKPQRAKLSLTFEKKVIMTYPEMNSLRSTATPRSSILQNAELEGSTHFKYKNYSIISETGSISPELFVALK